MLLSGTLWSRKTSLLFVIAGGALTLTSCVRQVRTVSYGAHPTAVSAVMTRQIENAVDAGEGDVEIRALRKRLAADPLDLDARVLLARQYSRRGLPDLALEHYRLAAAQFPDSAVAALSLAATLREMGEPGEALKAIRQYPRKDWQLLSLEGILEDDQGQFATAEKAHRAALAMDPRRSALHNNLGYNLLLQGKPDDAAAEFRRAIEIDPHSDIARNNLGTALAAQSHSSEAIGEWQRSAGPAVAHNNLAAVLIEQGRYAEARAEIDAALELRREFPAALANLRLVAERDGQPATVPAVPPHVNLWKRFASTFGTVVGGRAAKPAASAGSAEGK